MVENSVLSLEMIDISVKALLFSQEVYNSN